ncbi:MAG: virulence RhuM family protein [bacterium]
MSPSIVGKSPSGSDRSPEGQILIYQDGTLNLQVRLDGATVWLSQKEIAELYQVSLKTVNEHLLNVFAEQELDPGATIRKFRIVQREGNRKVARLVDHYNLEAILAVGYRVRSPRGTQFRQWATARLGELLVKGFTLDDERIKAGRTIGQDYFDELLARIRDIRASERLFYQKVTDIYATSIDYDSHSSESREFFKIVQNKLHFAAHGHTAAEVIQERADSSRPNMGLTTWKNAPRGPVRKADVTVAKNYLQQEEIAELNRIVTMYLDFAEDQARRGRVMHMADWTAQLDKFLQFNERGILLDAGSVSHALADARAQAEFERFDRHRREEADAASSAIDELKTGVKSIGEATTPVARDPKPRIAKRPKQ